VARIPINRKNKGESKDSRLFRKKKKLGKTKRKKGSSPPRAFEIRTDRKQRRAEGKNRDIAIVGGRKIKLSGSLDIRIGLPEKEVTYTTELSRGTIGIWRARQRDGWGAWLGGGKGGKREEGRERRLGRAYWKTEFWRSGGNRASVVVCTNS